MFHIFTCAVNEINSKKNIDFSIQSRWYKTIKPYKNYKSKDDPLISIKQERIRKDEKVIFEMMFNFLLIVTRKYSIQYS